MRANSNRTSDHSSLDALNRTIEGLEARIESLITSAASRQTARHAPSEPAPRGNTPQAADIRQPDSAHFDPIADIRRRQQALDATRDNARDMQRDMPRERSITPPENAHYNRSNDPYAAQNLAQSLSNLRSELKHDLTDSLAREMQLLRNEILAMRALAENQRPDRDLASEFERLQSSVERLGAQRSPDSERLRMDIEDLRMSVDQMAREDSISRLDRRWDGLETQLRSFDTGSLQSEIMSLAYRLDDIKTQLGAFSDNPSIRTVEKKLIALAELVEQLGRHMKPNDAAVADQFAALDNRLDEISRAIAAASNRPLTQNIDNAVAHRIEARLNSLSEHFDDLNQASSAKNTLSGTEFNQRIDSLTARVEDLAKQRSVAQLEERLEQLSQLVERSQSAAMQPELSSFLNDLSHKIDALDSGYVSNDLNARLELLSRQIGEMDERFAQPQQTSDYDTAFTRLEERLGDIASRLDESTASGSSDSEALLSLEGQIAHLSSLISQPSYQDPGSMTAYIDSRMSAIEQHLASNDEYIIEVARQAAEAVLDSYMRNHGPQGSSSSDMQMLSGLADDLRSLENLTKSSEERTHKTFEALHDTLVQIAGRLDTLDQRSETFSKVQAQPAPAFSPSAAPSHPQPFERPSALAPMPQASFPDRGLMNPLDTGVSASAIDAFLDDTQAAIAVGSERDTPEQAQKRGLIKSLTQRFRTSTAPSSDEPAQLRIKVDPAPSLDPTDALEADNELLEPGSGQPDIKQILERVRASQASNQRRQPVSPESRADIIAAARRAAAAAAQESIDSDHDAGTQAAQAQQTQAKSRSRFRRPILLGVGAILLALLALPIVKTVSTSLKGPQTAIELNAPAASTIEAPFSTSSIMTPGDFDSRMQADADRMEAQADAMPLAIDQRTIGGAPLADAPAQSSTTIEPSENRDTNASTIASPAAAPLEVPAAIQPTSLADAAKVGDVQALFEVASRFVEGRSGVAQDRAEAAKWYQLAAAKGHAMSQYRLASMFEKANGVEQDLAQARRYYELAATQGNAGAMHNLAVLLTSNAVGAPDFEKATEWFTKAADLGVSDSQYNLAILYARGSGVKTDLVEAYKWFAIAARDGDSDAAEKRDQIAQAMPADLLESAKAKFASWQPKPLNEDANSVNPPDAWTEGGAVPTASVDMEKAIRNIQAILNKNGFMAGNADGKLGQNTVQAIKAFQTSVGLEPDGLISDKLVTALLERNR